MKRRAKPVENKVGSNRAQPTRGQSGAGQATGERARHEESKREPSRQSNPAADTPTRPKSATNFALSLVALVVGLGLAWVIGPWHPAVADMLPYTAVIPCIGIVAVIAVAEWWAPALRGPGIGRSSTEGIARAAIRPLSLRRVATRVCGLSIVLGLVALVYWLMPEYHGDFYAPFWRFLRTVAPVAVLIPFYFAWADCRTGETRDEYLALGSVVLGGSRAGDGPLIRRLLLGWTVKAFFLPLMTVYLGNELRSLYGALQAESLMTMNGYQVFYHLSYAIDLLFCVVGYSTTVRLFDAQIRSVEPTVAGWVIALMCYQPFYSVIGKYYLQYDDATFWDNWLAGWPVTSAVWATLVISLSLIYALCTVSFGLRFSNLTHRGIITGGPYRFSKHPAYLAKNLSWWLISVPFVSELGWSAAVRNCCLLGLLNLVYFARARTEEKHLSRDPTYVAYALWMNDHGLLRRVGQLIPFMRYRAPTGAGAESSAPARQMVSDP